MQREETPYRDELERSIDWARQAGKIALEIHDTDYDVDRKSEGDPVTDADRAVNRFLVTELGDAFSDDLIVAEESAAPDLVRAERAWFVDPIDGTKDFLKKNGEWSIMIGFAVSGRARLGVVYQPALDRLYVGVVGGPAFAEIEGEQKPLACRTRTSLEGATMTSSRSHPDPMATRIAERWSIDEYRHGSVGLKLSHIAEQRADLYVNSSGKCHMWDVCGPEAIIAAAGGSVRDFDGNPIIYRGESTRVAVPFAAASDSLWPELSEALLDR